MSKWIDRKGLITGIKWLQSVGVLMVILGLVVILVLVISWEPIRFILTAVIAVLTYVFTKGFLDAGFNLRKELAALVKTLLTVNPTEFRPNLIQHKGSIAAAAVQIPKEVFPWLSRFRITPSFDDLSTILDDVVYLGTTDINKLENLKEYGDRVERIFKILKYRELKKGLTVYEVMEKKLREMEKLREDEQRK